MADARTFARNHKQRTMVKYLSGGNPQIAKGDGDAPVQAYIAAMPEWKQRVGKELDALITRAIPRVKKGVRWNTPMYGTEDMGWCLGSHCTMNYVKVAFFMGAHLEPPPPVASTQKNVRYLHVHEDDAVDKKQFTAWVKQASRPV